jgi:hypothetical protein
MAMTHTPNNDYILIDVLGRGSAGEVFLARKVDAASTSLDASADP